MSAPRDTLRLQAFVRCSPETLEKKSLMTQPPNDQTPEQPEQSSPSQESSAPEAPQAPQPPAAPQAPQFSAPQPPAAPQAPQFAAPAAPQQPSYSAQPPHFSAPQAPQAPQQPQFNAPQQPGQPQFAPPTQQAPQYGTPQAPAYGQPAAPQYGAPAAPQYGQPAPQYGAPAYAAAAFPSALGVVPGPGGPFDGALSPDDMSRPLYGASFGQAVRRFFKGYVKFSGRASRSEYWWSYLFLALLGFVPGIIITIGLIMGIASLATTMPSDPYSGYSPTTEDPFAVFTALFSGPSGIVLILGLILATVLGLGTLLPHIAISWRRLHDVNLPGPIWLISLVSYIPYIGSFLGFIAGVALIVLACLPPKAEGRRFDSAVR